MTPNLASIDWNRRDWNRRDWNRASVLSSRASTSSSAVGPIAQKAREVHEVMAYHRLSSLEPERAPAMPERLDRESQPSPFRRYEGAPRVELPLAGDADPDLGAEPSSVRLVAQLLEDSLALAGWKRHGEAWFGLRMTPSAGNLHPIECHVVTADLEVGARLDGSLHHYSVVDHALERRRELPPRVWESLRAACPRARAFLVLSSLVWRTAWKYGERAFRLCQLDAGHAVAALDAAAANLGHRIRWIDASADALDALVGWEATRPGLEGEDPVCLLALEPRDPGLESDLEVAPGSGGWRPAAPVVEGLIIEPTSGRPSRLSASYRDWLGLRSATRATRRRATASNQRPWHDETWRDDVGPYWPREVLRARRSRSDYADRPLATRDFVGLLDRVVGREARDPFPGRGDVAALVFVHRVDGVEPGLYAAVDGATPRDDLQRSMQRDLPWEPSGVEGSGWRLLRLVRGDARRAASHLAGRQPAAGDGACTVLFLGRFRALLREGASAYRRLHWQAGARGHALYLEAEARGLGATGLGGFFDEAICTLLGLEGDTSWRPLYLVAVGRRGGADARLEPPYRRDEDRTTSAVSSR